MINGIHTLDDYDLRGKTVLVREDMNSPLDPVSKEPRDITRIRESLPTIKELSEKGAKTVILIHQGNDIEYHSFGSTKPHARIASQFLGKPVDFIDDVCGPAARNKIQLLKNGQILMLENVRYMAEEMTLFEMKINPSPEVQAKSVIVSKLAPLADLYICDAFAAAHRSQPTLVGFEEVMPSAMGRLLEKEMASLSRLLKNPEKPCLFVLGGAKIQDAFMMMSCVLESNVADLILTTGLVGQIMLLAKGVSLGNPSREFIKKKSLDEYIEKAKGILSKFEKRIVVPVDMAYSQSDQRKEIKVSQLPVEQLLMDIGSESAAEYARLIKGAKTIFFNGPAGVFEKPETELGTKTVLSAIAESDAYSVLGGGDSIAAVNKFKLADGISYISTGGGALVRFLSGEELPIITALKKAAKKFPCEKRTSPNAG
jgi:phosphoglycerate kinase